MSPFKTIVLAVVCSLGSMVITGCTVDEKVEDPIVDTDNDGNNDVVLGDESPKKILWLGAHPDDEHYVAPYLADNCLDSDSAQCKMIIFTAGESGVCGLPGGCNPDLQTVRAQEMVNAANHLNSELIHLDLGDSKGANVEAVLNHWGGSYASTQAMVDWLSNEIAAFQPDVILTFDPRHGSSCHNDHRAAGYLTLLAADKIDFDPSKILLVETIYHILIANGDHPDIMIPAPPVSDDSLLKFSYFGKIEGMDKSPWDYLTNIFEIHQSQFTGFEIESSKRTESQHRASYFLSFDKLIADDNRYLELCD